MNIGERIFRLRTQRGLSQEELAEALGVSRQSVSKWETNASVPELEKIMKMCELFGVSLDELVRGAGAAPGAGGAGRYTAAQITGGGLLVFGALAMLMLLAVDKAVLMLMIALPSFLCGLICLILRRPLLPCLWVLLLEGGICFFADDFLLWWHGETIWVGLLMAFLVLVIATIFRLIEYFK